MTAQWMGPGTTDPTQRVGPLPTPVRPLEVRGQELAVVGKARIYVCGITPYDVAHLGHAATFVWADVVASIIELLGVKVVLSRNITDIDDVLTEAAAKHGRHFDEFALTQVAEFDRMMRNLRVPRPTIQPHARHYVTAVQQLASALLANGSAYEAEGTVWFKGNGIEERVAGGREQAWALSKAYGDQPDDPAKRDPFDVPIWRPSQPGQPAWPSPWGWGRPGWHAECAAMALAVHGASVDLLIGGCDLAFPHHAYQSAMVEAASSVQPFNRATVHVGEVRLDGARMAKSTQNLVVVDDVLAHHEAAALRLLLLDRPIDQAWEYREEDLAAAADRLARLREVAAAPAGTDPEPVVQALARLDVQGAVQAALADGAGARLALRVLRLGLQE